MGVFGHFPRSRGTTRLGLGAGSAHVPALRTFLPDSPPAPTARCTMQAVSPSILVAVDDDAGPALRYAVDAARRAGCAVHVLHVVVPGSVASALGNGEQLLHAAAAHAQDLGGGLTPVSTELAHAGDRQSTRLNSSHLVISYAVFCLKKKNHKQIADVEEETHNHIFDEPVRAKAD